MPEPLLQLDNVTVRFGLQTVLRGVTLAMHPGETVAIIGESGCGKTVTLKLMVGLLNPTSGRALFEGRDIAAMNEQDLTALRQRVGFLFQSAALFDSLSVFDNIAFGPRAHGKVDDKKLDSLVSERLTDVGLTDAVKTKMPAELSGGMRKRVGLARALALDPDAMLYDEPTTGLDPVMTGVINDLILQTRARRPITSVVVTHELRTVRTVAERVVMLEPLARLAADQPQVIFDGPVADLATSRDPRVIKFMGGVP
jgi:phospholipid/cholesterol/gamma-HCH transport system ATP-binding protein